MSSIRARLLVSLLTLLGIAAALLGALTYRNVLAETEALFDYQLQQMALSLRDQGEIDSAQADTLADEKLDVVVQIWTVDGRIVYASRRHEALPARAVVGLATLEVQGRAWRTFSVASRARVIQVAQPVGIRQALAARAAWRAVLPLIVLAPLAALAVGWVASRSLAPLHRLAAELRGRDAGSLLPLAPAATRRLPDEVAPLAAALDALLERLRGAVERERAFTADAAHELRSPLTALKLQLGLLRRAGNEPDRGLALAALAGGIDRATRGVEQLLALARSEPGGALVPHEPVDLALLARDAIAATVPFAQSRQIEIELDAAPGAAAVTGDPVALAHLVRNLVDNAVRYAPPGSRVRAAVEASVDATTLVVDDAGPGIPEAERPRVFDRFYRRPVTDSHSPESGSGLGLAIVRSVASAHRAEVALDTSPLGGLRVSVRFARDGVA